MAWEIVVGLETHAQLATQSKMFSGAATAFGAPPNSQACAVDLALPGVLPVANAAAVALAVKFGLAVGGRINARSVFARKNYFYPDLPKGYQISQYEIPIVAGGALTFAAPGGEKTVRLTRAHLEEDAGKSLHELPHSHRALGHGMSGIDLNRAGTPLLEIVSEPELRGAKEAVAYARALHALVRWIGVCDGNMQEGSFRCDANVSVRRAGDAKLGTRCEIKNLNSFRFMEQAIEFEARRQIALLEDGGAVVQETRLYDPDKGETRSMRTKEEAHDYRYFPDPDLLPLAVSTEDIERLGGQLPELPQAMARRLQSAHGLSEYDARLITASRETARYFEQVAAGADPKLAANWINGELASRLNEDGIDIGAAFVSAEVLAWMIGRIADGTISNKIAKDKIFPELWRRKNVAVGKAEFEKLIADNAQVSDAGAIERIVDEVLAKNARQVEDYRAGKDKAFNSLIGQVMKATQGKANPAQVNELLKKKLAR
ncbi:MAG TPA: Asp-tRNA(Asn)/Glu-tRNA(Gln) amidotransferase subunit GatB [Burkholderiales bacterium]|nr:Asp-tRNA(Asn)/Glu-tRNA(Gln) amidotransferase subunit GatB [Burkholderiales bacterium]